MHLLVVLLASYLFKPAHAVVCRETLSLNGTTSCEGDYCIVMGRRDFESTDKEQPAYVDYGCLGGSAFPRFNSYCWATNRQSFCVCDTDRCTDEAILPPMRPGSLKCGEEQIISRIPPSPSEGCYGCHSTVEFVGNETRKSQGCSDLGMAFVSEITTVQRNWASEQTLQSEAVTCYVDSSANETCKGDLCLIDRSLGFMSTGNVNGTFEILQRGCLTSNETLFDGLFQIMYGSDVGILQTAVTWSDFESRLRAALGTEARLGPNKSVLDIGDGKGLTSLIGLITCDWVDATEGELLPSTVALKIPTNAALRRLNDSLPQKMFDLDEAGWAAMEKQMHEIHNTEVATYDFFAEFDGLSIPRLYCGCAAGAEDVRGQLCLEYVGHSRMMNFYEKHTVEVVRQIARAIGKLQACSLKKEPTDPSLDKDFFDIMTARRRSIDTVRAMFKGIFAFDDSERTHELIEKVCALVPKYHGSKLASKLHEQMGYRRVIVNGDLHTGNVLIDECTGDLAAIVDWQITHLGVGVEDLHRIAMSALTTNDRRASMSMLLEEMYSSLVENLDGAEPPYTLHTLRNISDLIFPHCAVIFASTFIAGFKQFNKDPAISEAERATRSDIMLDKLVGTLEDIVDIDHSNTALIEMLKLSAE